MPNKEALNPNPSGILTRDHIAALRANETSKDIIRNAVVIARNEPKAIDFQARSAFLFNKSPKSIMKRYNRPNMLTDIDPYVKLVLTAAVSHANPQWQPQPIPIGVNIAESSFVSPEEYASPENLHWTMLCDPDSVNVAARLLGHTDEIQMPELDHSTGTFRITEESPRQIITQINDISVGFMFTDAVLEQSRLKLYRYHNPRIEATVLPRLK
jgi:hypothetical protein